MDEHVLDFQHLWILFLIHFSKYILDENELIFVILGAISTVELQTIINDFYEAWKS